MSRVLFPAEKGLRLYKENSDTAYIDFIFGAGAPAGTSGETDDAPIGSQYNNTTNGSIYKKVTSTSSAVDWIEIGNVNLDELKWRNEKVRAATVDTVAAGTVDPTAFSDNESGLDGNDFVVGEYLIGDVDGTPALFEVTVVTGAADITVVAASQAISSNDTFIVQAYLPDPGATQESQAIIHFPLASGAAIKISDFDWNLADGITLNGYADSTGAIAGTETVQVGIQKVEKGLKDVITSLGLSRNDLSFGSFINGALLMLPGASTAKALFQKIGDLLAQLRGVQVVGLTTLATVDSVPHASVKACKWLIEAFEVATPTKRKAFEVYALTDGTNVDDTVYSKLKLGANFNLVLAVDINGADMRLRASSSTAGVTITARRIEVVKSVL